VAGRVVWTGVAGRQEVAERLGPGQAGAAGTISDELKLLRLARVLIQF